MPLAAVVFLSFLTGFTSMTAEFLLIQLSANLLGGTLLWYALSLGVFVTSMGLGSMFHRPSKPTAETFLFYKVEILLSLTLLVTPFLFFILEGMLPFLPYVILIHGLMALIGFLTGMELPVLNSLEESLGSKRRLSLLFDYMGMFFAALVFPLILIHQFKSFSIFFGLALVNAVIALLLRKGGGKAWKWAWVPVLALCLFVLIFDSKVEQALTRIYLGHG